jgi:PPK2 family polyphosphate:nucleotide phosphotransferase
MRRGIESDSYRAVPGAFRLRDFRPDALPRGMTNTRGAELLENNVGRLRELQEQLYADGRWSLLVILQGMDTAGKDSAIKRVFSGLNPQGCAVHSFKAPSPEELAHDYLWRTTVRLPERGQIGIFNRSYYEEVLAVRVNPDLLDRQRLPRTSARIWRDRFEDIAAHERHLVRNGTAVRKIFLHISPKEQRERLLKRLENPTKHWKFSPRDIDQRQHWREYMRAYDDCIRATSTDVAPWYVVPADRKWWAGAILSDIIVDALSGMRLRYPELSEDARRDMRQIRQALNAHATGRSATRARRRQRR